MRQEFDVVGLGGGVAGEASQGCDVRWYAAYIVARERGATAEEAVKAATLHMEGAAQDAQV